MNQATLVATGTNTRPSLYRTGVLHTLRKFSHGHLALTLPDGTTVDLGAGPGHSPAAQLHVHDEDFFRDLALHAGVGLGESYIDGLWSSPDLRAVVTWLITNIRAERKLRGSSQRLPLVGLLKIADRVAHLLRPNSLKTSRRNISEHYDLGNDFYKLWLDPSLTYSSAKFTSDDQPLEEAQRAKYHALCQRLHLQQSDHVLEIGCGWGGFSIHAASSYGCRVTAVTISQAQFDEATSRVASAGLGHLVTVVLKDYRLLTGSFDKIASIEMLEAVGDRYLATYFKKCHELLAPDGILALQYINVPDNEHADLRKGTDFIQKHIFPGSLLLSNTRIAKTLNRTGDLDLVSFEDLTASYAKTLGIWYDRFNAVLDDVHALGFDDRFVRKWNFYLKYCEAAFATRNIGVVQAAYTRPNNTTIGGDA